MSNKNPVELYNKFPTENQQIYFSVKDRMTTPSYPMHWHNYIEVLYIIEGTNVARCNNDVFEVVEDSFCIINSNELHQNISGLRRYAFILFNPTIFNKNDIILNRIVTDAYLSEIMKKMIAECNKDEFSDFNIQGYALLLITHLYRNYAYKTVDSDNRDSYSQKLINLNNCIKYIHNNYNKNISLQDVANIENLNKYYFCNIFKEFTGQTFKEYHNKLRITKAIELLCTTNLPIIEIAFLCGYNDSNYFTRKFRQITGKTPNAIRRELKENKTTEFY